MLPEDIELISSFQGTGLSPEQIRDIAGKWAAAKVRTRVQRAAARALWDQYYLLGDLADDFDRGEL